jgi:hypothetical protein
LFGDLGCSWFWATAGLVFGFFFFFFLSGAGAPRNQSRGSGGTWNRLSIFGGWDMFGWNQNRKSVLEGKGCVCKV